MRLYLVQHGQAHSKDIDPERSLSEEGRSELSKMAAFLEANATIEVSRIFHSGKTRAIQTAELLAQQIRPSDDVSAASGLEPLADPAIWAEKLKQMQSDIMLVGHLPHLSRLASLLIAGKDDWPVINFHNGGIVCLTGNDSNGWIVNWIIIPDILA